MHQIQPHFSQQRDSFAEFQWAAEEGIGVIRSSEFDGGAGLALRSEAVDSLLDALRVGLSLVRLRQSGADKCVAGS